MLILSWPKKGSNPYNEILYKEIEKQDNIEVLSHREYRFAGIFYKVDFFHFHWINAYLNHKPLKAFVSTMMFMLYVKLFKFRGAKIIWTIHNTVQFTHHGKNKFLENKLVPFLLDNVDKIIIHSQFQKEHLDKKYHNKIVWIAHHNYCSILDKNKLKKEKYYLFFGGIDKYKGVEDAIIAYKKLENKTIPFKIIGRVNSKDYKDKLLKLIDNDKNIILEDRFLEDEELEILVKEAKAVILPFKQITNSGSLIYALSCNTKVMVKKSVLTDEMLSLYQDLDKVLLTFKDKEELVESFNKDTDYDINGFKDFIKKTNIEKVVKEYFKKVGFNG